MNEFPLFIFSSLFKQSNRHDFFISDGTENYLLYGPYITLGKGSYIFEIDFEMASAANEDDTFGYIDMMASPVGKIDDKIIEDKTSINTTLFKNNKLSLNVKLTTAEDIDRFQLRVFVKEGVILKITKIKHNIKNRPELTAYTAFTPPPPPQFER
jgi:hypothetical protein